MTKKEAIMLIRDRYDINLELRLKRQYINQCDENDDINLLHEEARLMFLGCVWDYIKNNGEL